MVTRFLRRPAFGLSLLVVLTTVALVRCGNLTNQSTRSFESEVWSQNVLGVLGGTLMATEGEGRLALNRGALPWIQRLDRWLDPIPRAEAYPQCPTYSICVGSIYQTESYDCLSNQFQNAGMWRALHRVALPDADTCEAVKASGFTADVLASLEGKSIKRTYGSGVGANANQRDVWRMGMNEEAVMVYTDFPSGSTDPHLGKIVKGGVKVTFGAGERRIEILGVHLRGWRRTDKGSMFVGDKVPFSDIGYNNPKYKIQWDTTLYTPEDTSIVVSGYGAEKKVTSLRAMTFHNIAKTLAETTLKNNEPLLYGSTQCCWPTSGSILTKFTPATGSIGPSWQKEEVVFHSNCGEIDYITYVHGVARKRAADLYHCY